MLQNKNKDLLDLRKEVSLHLEHGWDILNSGVYYTGLFKTKVIHYFHMIASVIDKS